MVNRMIFKVIKSVHFFKKITLVLYPMKNATKLKDIFAIYVWIKWHFLFSFQYYQFIYRPLFKTAKDQCNSDPDSSKIIRGDRCLRLSPHNGMKLKYKKNYNSKIYFKNIFFKTTSRRKNNFLSSNKWMFNEIRHPFYTKI